MKQRGPKRKVLVCKINAKAQNYYFSIRFYWFFEVQGVHVGRKNRSWSVLEASWGVLEASEGVLEASWGILGRSWRHLRASERRLEAGLRRQGAVLGPNAPRR